MDIANKQIIPVETEVATQELARSVQQPPITLHDGPGPGNSLTMWLASIADSFTPWGTDVHQRDLELRDWWHTEPILSGAIFSVVASNAAMRFKIEGPEVVVDEVKRLFRRSHFSKGMQYLIKLVSTDLYTQDNGAIVEVIRKRNAPTAPVIGLAHLESNKCLRTGDLRFPIIYTDRHGKLHRMPWYSVVTFEEMPSPIRRMNGVGYCAVTRILRAAQIMRDLEMYRGEKMGGRFTEAIHVIGGVKASEIEDVLQKGQQEADNAHLARYLKPVILSSLDPQTTPSVATLDLKALPESFNFDDEMKWYISMIALSFGRDYQDFAPLPGGGLGTSNQSDMLHQKTRGKGPATWQQLWGDFLNDHVLPEPVRFSYMEQDLEAQKLEAQNSRTRADARSIAVDSMEITPEVARMLAVRDGDLTPAMFAKLQLDSPEPIIEEDLTIMDTGGEETDLDEDGIIEQ